MNTLEIRRATVNDVDALAPLFDAYRQFYEQAPDLDLAASFLRDRLGRGESVVLLAVDPALGAIGFCQMYPGFCSVEAAPIVTLYDLYVRPEARRTGAGRALMLAAEAHCRAHGVARMDLSTAHSNVQAQALYESLGWVRDTVYFVYNRSLGD